MSALSQANAEQTPEVLLDIDVKTIVATQRSKDRRSFEFAYELPGLVAGLGSREARRRSDELLNSLGLADKADVTPSKLSGGEQQRVAIARALINRPAILLADEPTGNLDSQTSRETLNVLRDYHDGGQTILMVTHDALVAAAADRVLSMRDGEIVDETRLEPGTPSRTLLSRLIELEV